MSVANHPLSEVAEVGGGGILCAGAQCGALEFSAHIFGLGKDYFTPYWDVNANICDLEGLSAPNGGGGGVVATRNLMFLQVKHTAA